MTCATQQTSHCIIAYPNASGCVTLTAPGTGTKTGDLDNMSKVSDLRRKSVNIKSYHTVTKALTYIEASLSNRVSLAIGYGMREGTLRVLEDDIFSIDNVETFDAAVERLRNIIMDFKGNPFSESKGNPFSESMSYASSMGGRMGIVYDTNEEDWDDEVETDKTFPASGSQAFPSLTTVSLPPFGLPLISQRRVTSDPSREPLAQRPERDKISESVMKKYERIPPEERCYV